jgi:hypothetical protein
MLREKNYTQEQLRTIFMEMKEGQGWFTREFQDNTNDLYGDSDTGVDHTEEAIRGLFGNPPYEFLLEGDVPETFLSGKRKLVRSRGASEYKAMRGDTINYDNLPRNPHFIDNENPHDACFYWIPGATMSNDTSPMDIIHSAMNKSTSLYGLKMQIKIPVQRKNKSTVRRIPRVGDSLYLFSRVKEKNKKIRSEYACIVTVQRVEIVEGAATGSIYVVV